MMVDTNQTPPEASALRKIVTKGTVSSGKGVGGKFIGIGWVRRQIGEKLGFDPYLGTLNLVLEDEDAQLLHKRLTRFVGTKITPEEEGFFQARVYQALVMEKIESGAIIPEKPRYPPNILEVISSDSLRETLSLKDGDTLEISIVALTGSTV